MKYYKKPEAIVTAELLTRMNKLVSNRTINMELHKLHIYGKAAISKKFITNKNTRRSKAYFNENKNW